MSGSTEVQWFEVGGHPAVIAGQTVFGECLNLTSRLSSLLALDSIFTDAQPVTGR